MIETVGLILGSAAVGALISSGINAWTNVRTKRQELEREDMAMAFKMAELKHHQMVITQEWNIKHGQPAKNVSFWDPLMSVIHYRRGVEEFRRTCTTVLTGPLPGYLGQQGLQGEARICRET